MLQWKKLQYYARQNGIEDYRKVKLTDDDCEYICSTVGISPVSSASVSQRFDILVSHVMDDLAYRDARRNPNVSEEIFLIRCGDYAAMDVFKAYAAKHHLSTDKKDSNSQ